VSDVTTRRVLIYGGEPSPYHDFSAQGPILAELARGAGWEPELTRDGDALLSARVAPFQAVMVAASSGLLSPAQEEGLLSAVIGAPGGDTGAPKGLLGVHGATVLSSASGRYQRMIGARFLTHPEVGPTGPAIRVNARRSDHPILSGVGDFTIVDELYLLEQLSPFEVLLSADHLGFERPLAWVKPFGQGRVCYCALGHAPEQLRHPSVRAVLKNALAWFE
jgi:hypothetical protein